MWCVCVCARSPVTNTVLVCVSAAHTWKRLAKTPNGCTHQNSSLSNVFCATSFRARPKNKTKQQKVLLGAPDGSASEISAFALQNAQWMKAKIDYNLQFQRINDFLMSLAYSSDQTRDGKSSYVVINSPTCPSTKFTWTAGPTCSETLNTRADCSDPVVSTPITCAASDPGSSVTIYSGCTGTP